MSVISRYENIELWQECGRNVGIFRYVESGHTDIRVCGGWEYA